jgi:hypothetical protein
VFRKLIRDDPARLSLPESVGAPEFIFGTNPKLYTATQFGRIESLHLVYNLSARVCHTLDSVDNNDCRVMGAASKGRLNPSEPRAIDFTASVPEGMQIQKVCRKETVS